MQGSPWVRGRTIITVIAALAAAMTAGVGVAALFPAAPSVAALENFTPDFLAEAARYNRGAYLMFAFSRVFTIGLVSWLVFSPRGRGRLRDFLSLFPFIRKGLPAGDPEHRGEHRIWLTAGAAGGLVWLSVAIVKLPLGWLRGFYWEHRFGLSNQTFGRWLADYTMQAAIEAILAAAAFALLYALMDRWPRRWWLPAGTMLAVGLIALTALKPIIIDPMFHQFTPLADHELRGRLEEMASRLDLSVDQVLVMDASRRTRRSNAYFTGVGATRRIVLYDNLLDLHPREEVELVVAHELAHWHEGHVAKGLILGAGSSFAALFLFAWLLNELSAESPSDRKFPAEQGEGFSPRRRRRNTFWHRRDPAGTAVVVLAVVCIGIISLPGQNVISRRWEQRADRISYEISGGASTARDLAQRLTEANLSDVNRGGWIKLMLSTHPSPLERMEAARKHMGGEPGE